LTISAINSADGHPPMTKESALHTTVDPPTDVLRIIICFSQTSERIPATIAQTTSVTI
jgi:hypothetical protein